MIQGPYHFIPIGILFLITYLLSLLAARLRLWPQVRHKKLWNTILAAAFLSTAVIGLILAAKVNYKWNAPWFDKLLQWHVDIGAGLVCVAIFHFTWHLGYYKRLLIRSGPVSSMGRWSHDPGFTDGQIRLFFILLGAISMISQLVLLREFLKSLHGNELIIGLVLSVWMILTALGAWSGSGYQARLSRKSILSLLLIMSALPVLIYILNILVMRFLFLPGYEPGFLESIMVILILLLPVTLLSGFLFGYVVKSNSSKIPVSRFYMLDSIGSLTGGILFGALLVFFLENIQVLSLLVLATVIFSAFIFQLPSRPVFRLVSILAAAILTSFVMLPAGRNLVEGIRFKNETIIEYRDTPYNNLTYTQKDGQITVYANAIPCISSYDVIIAEESVHYFALQHPGPKSFLLISGGLYGTIDEILKYAPDRVDYCESDPDAVLLNKKYFEIPESDALHVRLTDGKSWMIKNKDPYDVIISLPGDPFTLGLNRYYTTDFFGLVKENLRENGVFGLKLQPSGNYINMEGLRLNSLVYNSLKALFKYVLIIPGASNYFIASDRAPTTDIPGLLREHEISNTYVSSDYLDQTHIKFDSDLLMDEVLKLPVETNSDLWPKGFYISVSGWLSKSGGNLRIYGLIGIAGFLVLLLFLRSLQAGIFVAGFSGAGIQILLIMVLQSFFGNAYIATPMMVSMFMGGIVLGVLSWKYLWKTASMSKFMVLIWSMAIYSGGLLVMLKQASVSDHMTAGLILLLILNLVPGVIIGLLYTMAINLAKEQPGKLAGTIFGADLAGAAAGTFLTGLLLLPVIGVTYTLILFSAINIVTGLYLLSSWGRRI